MHRSSTDLMIWRPGANCAAETNTRSNQITTLNKMIVRPFHSIEIYRDRGRYSLIGSYKHALTDSITKTTTRGLLEPQEFDTQGYAGLSVRMAGGVQAEWN